MQAPWTEDDSRHLGEGNHLLRGAFLNLTETTAVEEGIEQCSLTPFSVHLNNVSFVQEGTPAIGGNGSSLTQFNVHLTVASVK